MLAELSFETFPPNHQTHFRAMYTYLGLAPHHLELTEQDYDDDDEEIEERPSLEATFTELGEKIKASKTRQLNSRFNRVSPDLFLKLFSFADAPSLVRSSSVSKAWKDSIEGSLEFFRNFRMEEKESRSARGWRSSANGARTRFEEWKSDSRTSWILHSKNY